jgi:hypothetical protein
VFTNRVKLFVRAEKTNEEVQIYLRGPLTPGTRNLNFTTLPFPVNGNPPDYGIYIINYPAAEFITTDVAGGHVDLIEIDTLTNKVYGKFEFVGTDRSTGQQVQVTNGIFRNY